MSKAKNRLKEELRQAGAKTSEVDELTNIASELRKLNAATNVRRNRKQPGVLLIAFPLVISVCVICAIIVALAQQVTPTSWLYPVQKFTDNAAIAIHPQYRATVMMHTARQVNELVSSHAPSNVILSTLASYNNEASEYKAMSGTNYAAFRYCQHNLELAANTAPSNVRQAIINSLNSLDTT